MIYSVEMVEVHIFSETGLVRFSSPELSNCDGPPSKAGGLLFFISVVGVKLPAHIHHIDIKSFQYNTLWLGKLLNNIVYAGFSLPVTQVFF